MNDAQREANYRKPLIEAIKKTKASKNSLLYKIFKSEYRPKIVMNVSKELIKICAQRHQYFLHHQITSLSKEFTKAIQIKIFGTLMTTYAFHLLAYWMNEMLCARAQWENKNSRQSVIKAYINLCATYFYLIRVGQISDPSLYFTRIYDNILPYDVGIMNKKNIKECARRQYIIHRKHAFNPQIFDSGWKQGLINSYEMLADESGYSLNDLAGDVHDIVAPMLKYSYSANKMGSVVTKKAYKAIFHYDRFFASRADRSAVFAPSAKSSTYRHQLLNSLPLRLYRKFHKNKINA